MKQQNVFLPSYLNDLYAKSSVPVTWEDVFGKITKDTCLRTMTERYRNSGNEQIKLRLPCITPAVQLNGAGKRTEDIIGYTCRIPIDFDKLPAEALALAEQRIKADPHTFMCNRSVSGKGLHVLAGYVVEQGCSLTMEQAYDSAFLQANCHYADLIGFPFDEQCGNAVRAFSLSHDPQAYFNPAAERFQTTNAHELNTNDLGLDMQKEKGVENNNLCFIRGNSWLKTHWTKVERDPIEAAVEYVERQGLTYVQGHRNEYLMRCLMMMNRYGVACPEAERWALAHDGLTEREIRSVVRSCYRHTAEHGTFDAPCKWEQDPSLPSGLSHCHTPSAPFTHTRKEPTAQSSRSGSADPLAACAALHKRPSMRPCLPFPNHQWPKFIQQMVDCADTKPQQDVLLLGVITVLGSTLSRLLKFNYSRRFWHSALQTFVVAPPASGKSIITWARRLSDPLNEMLEAKYEAAKKEYDKQKAAYDNAGRERANMLCPEPPRMKLFQIAGNNSSSGIIENLDECDGWGLICESEADTLSAAINADYGNWGDILRRAFDHDKMLMYRRTNKERRIIKAPCLSVLISGTPAQVKPLIVSAENGQFSREIFLQLPAIDEFIDQFDENDIDLNARFIQWGRQWLGVWKALQTTASSIVLRLTPEQKERFNSEVGRIFNHAKFTQATDHMRSSVTREAINLLRIMSVVAFFRAIEQIADYGDDLRNVLEEVPAKGTAKDTGYRTLPLVKSSLIEIPDDVPPDNVKDGMASRFNLHITDGDFNAVLGMADPIYRYACDVLMLLPDTEAVRNSISSADLLLTRLPLAFNCKEAVAIGAETGLSESFVRNLLAKLVEQGKLNHVRRGNYELAFPSGVLARVCGEEAQRDVTK